MTNTRPDRIPEPKPQNARQTVALVRDDHRWQDKPMDINSTDGIKRNIDALWAAINQLAAYIDGERPTNGEPEPLMDGQPAEPERRDSV